MLDIFAGGFRGDDFDSSGPGTGTSLIALVVIPVEMGVNDIADGLVGELFDLLDERASSRGLGVSVDYENRIAKEDDSGVAVHFVGGFGDGCVNAVGDGLNIEEVLGARGDCGKEQESDQRQEALHEGSVRVGLNYSRGRLL